MIKNLQAEITALQEQLRVNKEFDDLISEKEASKKFDVSMWTLRSYRREGLIKKWFSIKGKNIMLLKSELLNILKNPV